MKKIALVLHNVRSTHNVGSMFRTADAMGVSKIYLCGYTPDPIDRFERPQKDIAKTALGAEQTVVWEHSSETLLTIRSLKEEGYSVCALEQAPQSISIEEYATQGDVALVVGSEVEGLSSDVLGVCDTVLEIPMFGSKESLNVSVSAGIALYALRTNN